MAIKTHDFYYELPPELIAQTPIQRRDASRLLTLDKRTGEIGHHHFYDLPQFLRPGDCLVLNDSRVLPARLLGRREPTGGACEVVLLIDRGENVWECLVRPGKKLREGAKLSFGDGALTAEVTAVLEGGNRLIRFTYEGIFLELLERLGKMPLPPYIKEELQDAERYQTVYAREEGSAAAPTASGVMASLPRPTTRAGPSDGGGSRARSSRHRQRAARPVSASCRDRGESKAGETGMPKGCSLSAGKPRRIRSSDRLA